MSTVQPPAQHAPGAFPFYMRPEPSRHSTKTTMSLKHLFHRSCGTPLSLKEFASFFFILVTEEWGSPQKWFEKKEFSWLGFYGVTKSFVTFASKVRLLKLRALIYIYLKWLFFPLLLSRSNKRFAIRSLYSLLKNTISSHLLLCLGCRTRIFSI